MTTYLSDTFTRANSTTSAGTPDAGGPYTAAVGTWGINSNQLYTPTSTANALLTAPGAADVDASFQASVLAANISGIVFRESGSTTFWLLGVSTSAITLRRRSAGTDTILWTSSGAPVAGDTIRVVAKGADIIVYWNGVRAFQCNDPFNQSATVVGFLINSSTAVRLDNASVVSPPADITDGVTGMTAKTPDDTAVGAGSSLTPLAAFAYLGHGTKTADTGAS